MTPWMRVDIAVVAIMAIVLTCTQGLKIDLSRLTFHRPSFHAQKRNGVCDGNPCESSKPFLCRSGATCIGLKNVCDGTWDCDDGFDEDPTVCNAAARPSYDDLFYFLENERKWMIPKLFNGADPQLVAHALTGRLCDEVVTNAIRNSAFETQLQEIWYQTTFRWFSFNVASDMNDFSEQVGLTDENIKLLRKAFEAAIEGDERPLLEMGMPERSWHEVQYVLQKIMDSGFKI